MPTTKKGLTKKAEKIIRIRVKNVKDFLPLDKLEEFQEDLKELSADDAKKLRSSILKLGFVAPFFVWRKPKGGAKMLDGHQRKKVLRELIEGGWTVPDLPVVFIDAENENEATQILLSITSQYGITDQDKFFKLLDIRGIDLPDVEGQIILPDVNIDIPIITDENLEPNRTDNVYSLGRKVVRIGNFTGFVNPVENEDLQQFIDQMEAWGEQFSQTNIIAERIVRLIMKNWERLIKEGGK